MSDVTVFAVVPIFRSLFRKYEVVLQSAAAIGVKLMFILSFIMFGEIYTRRSYFSNSNKRTFVASVLLSQVKVDLAMIDKGTKAFLTKLPQPFL